ncbi:hypothetical protein H1R20_g2646, partial [Candolleomyces eurysporus]
MVDLASLSSSDLIFVEGSLSNAQIVEFTAIIKALLALKYLKEVEPEKMGAQPDEPLCAESFEKARKFAGEQFDVLLEHAVEFCNDPQRSVDLKKALQEA